MAAPAQTEAAKTHAASFWNKIRKVPAKLTTKKDITCHTVVASSNAGIVIGLETYTVYKTHKPYIN